MPVNRKMMANMKKEYGSKKGERVYYAMENKMKKKTKYYGSGPFSKSEESKGYKVLCDASHLMEMDTDQVKNAGPLLARRVDPKKYRRSESTKGSY
jgi:hypothetical protein